MNAAVYFIYAILLLLIAFWEKKTALVHVIEGCYAGSLNIILSLVHFPLLFFPSLFF